MKFEESDDFPHKDLSEMDISSVSAYMQILSYMLCLFYSGIGKVWIFQRELSWD